MGHTQEPHDHDHQAVPSDLTLRVQALESLLVEKGLVDRAALDAVVGVGAGGGEWRSWGRPDRPAGSEHMTEDQLAVLVTRDSMVGVGKVSLAAVSGGPS